MRFIEKLGFPYGKRSTLLTVFLALLFSSNLFAQNGDYRLSCDQQDIHTYNGYVYELWQSDDATFDGCMITKNNGDFYVSWTQIRNTLARKGFRPGVPNQEINYFVNNEFSGNVFFGAYGWWRNPGASGHAQAVEYYVVEDWGVYRPTDGAPKVGEVTSNGGTYDIYISQKTNQPSVYPGITNFTQIKCIRKPGQETSSGSITMANHFNAWADEGWPVGDLYEVSMKIEGFSSGPSDPTSGGAYVAATLGTAGVYTGGSGGASGGLSGLYRLKAKWGGRYATSNNQNWAIVRETSFQNWSSQHWELINVSGNEYRLREQYGNRYLTGAENNGAWVRVTGLQSSWSSQIWILENISGSEYRLKNKWTGRYLRNKNSNWGEVNTANLNASGNAQRWVLEAVPENRPSIQPGGNMAFHANPASALANSKAPVNVFPNPTEGLLNIQCSDKLVKGNFQVELFRLTGESLGVFNVDGTSTVLDLSPFAKGAYLLRIIGDETNSTHRVLKH